MREPGTSVQVAEKIAGVIAIVAALVVLNGAWENQHNWQNLSWRIAMAALLMGLAVIVETHAVEALQRRMTPDDETIVPDFLRAGEPDTARAPITETADVEDTADVGERS